MNESLASEPYEQYQQQPDTAANGSTRLDTEGTGGDRSSLLYQSKEEKFQAILSRQVPDVEKRKKADFIVDSSQGLEHAAEQVDQIVRELTQ